jgi:hypothetical protein
MRSNCNCVCSDKFGFQLWLAVFEEHRDHFSQIILQFVECLALRMGAGEAGDKSDQQACLRTFFDNGCECAHNAKLVLSWLQAMDFLSWILPWPGTVRCADILCGRFFMGNFALRGRMPAWKKE